MRSVGKIVPGMPVSDGAWRVPVSSEEVLARVAEDGIETVRVLFVDPHGILRGKTVVAGALGSVFRAGIGVPSTLLLKDTSHRTVFPIWSDDPGISSGPMQGANNVILHPDPSSFRVLPWSPHSAWMLSDVSFNDGTPFPYSSPSILRRAMAGLEARGWTAKMGLEVEFHIFQRTDDALDHAQTTMPGAPVQTRALTQGFQYLSEVHYGATEEVLDLLRRTAQAMNLPVRSVEIEMGPSQFEITFEPAGPMEQAANMVMFRTMTKEVCARRGLHASFMAKPKLENIAANSWHIHQSVSDAEGRNLFIPQENGSLADAASGWIAGLLDNAPAASLLVAPTVNSYKRYQPFQLAPNRIAWGADNRGAMLRGLIAPGDGASRVENRAADSSANPYLAFASQLAAGMDGVTRGLAAPAPTASPYDPSARALPANLGEALAAFEGSAMFRDVFGPEFIDYMSRIKRAEWERYLATVSEWEQAEYFNLL